MGEVRLDNVPSKVAEQQQVFFFSSPCQSAVRGACIRRILSGMGSVSAGSVQAITGAILSYSSSASAPNLDPFAFKEAALARLRNVAVSFESGASR